VSASGVLIAESLLKRIPFDCIDLQVHTIRRADVGDVGAGQPLTWTFIEFEVEDEVVGNLADALSRTLDPSGGWYCAFQTDTETFVVFADRVFQYARDEARGKEEAEAYGRSVGVPEAQLDW
jgi:hypothetical protein